MTLSSRQKEALASCPARCVTAGAGAGKTKVLVEKYIQLLGQGASVDQILALTFTEKAAAEMKDRVRRAIWDGQGESWKGLRDEFNWCQISTFHSFCARLIREHPLESGVSPGFDVLDDMHAEELKNDAFEHLLSLTKEDPLFSTMVSVLSETSDRFLREALLLMFGQRTELHEFFRKFSDPEELVQEWRKQTRKAVCRTAASFLDDDHFMDAVSDLSDLCHVYAGDRDAGCKYLAKANEHLAVICSAKNPADVRHSLRELSAVKGRRDMGSAKVFSPQDLAALQAAYDVVKTKLENCPAEALRDDDDDDLMRAAILTCDLRDVYLRFEAIIQAEKGRMNVLDFDDMVQIVRRMLDEDVDLAKDLSQRYRHVLVDEFQDTDRGQSEIVWRIVDGSASKDRLFIVGDPKQSIYQFRNVDVSMFKLAQKRIREGLEGASTHLDINFRSAPQLIDFVNRVFHQLMPPSSKDFEFCYERMEDCPLRHRDEGTVEMLVQTGGEDALEDEAELVASRVRRIVDDGELRVYWDQRGDHIEGGRGPRFGDIAILFRSRTRLKLYERRLRDLGIPYHVHAGLGFFQSQEILDIMNVLRFLDDRGDDVSLYAALRSPYFAFSDDELFLICSSGKGDLFTRLKICSEEGDKKARAAVMLLEEWSSIARRAPLPDLLRAVSLRSGIYSVYGALRNGEQMIANLEKLWQKALELHGDGFASLEDFVEWLWSRAEEEEAEGEAQLDTSHGDVVHIMTVHAAKGLEYPIVLVPEMSSKLMSDSSQINFDPERGIGMSVPDVDEGYKLRPTSVKVLIDAEAKEKQVAERKRLLYVAMTRAKDHLILSGEPPKEKPREVWMDWIWQSLELTREAVANGSKRLGDGLALRMTSRVSVPEATSSEDEAEVDLDGISASFVPMRAMPEGRDRLVLTPSMVIAIRRDPSAFQRHHVLGIPEVGVEGFGSISAEKLGSAMHETLRGVDPKLALRSFGSETEARVKRMAEERERFLDLDEIKRACRHLTEVSLMGMIGEELVVGKIDRLVFADEERYALLDYKTDAIARDGEEQVAKEYELQLAIYSELLAPLIGTPERSQLYFVSNGHLHDIRVRTSILAENLNEIANRIREIMERS